MYAILRDAAETLASHAVVAVVWEVSVVVPRCPLPCGTYSWFPPMFTEQSSHRFRVLSSDYKWTIFTLEAHENRVTAISNCYMLNGPDLVGLSTLKEANIELTDGVFTIVGLCSDSSVLYIREHVESAKGLDANDASAVSRASGRLLAKLTVSDQLNCAFRNLAGDTVFVIMADM